MGVPVTDYTGTDAIRGAVGVTDNEVTDDMLSDQSLELELTVDLDQWIPDHATLWAAGKVAGADAVAVLKSNYIALYSQWFCAVHVIEFMRLAIPQMISDGKAEMRRFQKMDLQVIQDSAGSRAAHYKSLLSAAAGTAEAENMSFVSVSTPIYDPVAGQ